MLRSLVIALGVVCFVGGLAAFTGAGWPGGIGPTIFGALLILGTLFERLVYKQVESGRPGPGWVATDERFVDEDNRSRWSASGWSPRARRAAICRGIDYPLPFLRGRMKTALPPRPAWLRSGRA